VVAARPAALVAAFVVLGGCGRIDFPSVPAPAARDAAVPDVMIDALEIDASLIDPCATTYAAVYGQSHYRFATTPDTWDNAERACEADGRGSHLVVFNDGPEMNAIEALVVGAVVWVGISDRVTDGKFIDVMGEIPLFLPQWQTPDPSFSGPGCVEFNPGSRQIHDLACSTKVVYVCECDGVVAQPSSY
jgi:hypothetical protein